MESDAVVHTVLHASIHDGNVLLSPKAYALYEWLRTCADEMGSDRHILGMYMIIALLYA